MKIKILRVVLVMGLLLSVMALPAFAAQQHAASPAPAALNADKESVIFFASDGMRQDLVEAYANQGLMPTLAKLLRSGAKAADGGLLTQAPPNTGAGWYSLATGAWSGVHGSTNNTFAVNGQAMSSRVAAFDAGVVQAETLAQAAERGGKKVAQIEWAGGRVGVINGPTVDYRGFFSGRGVATNYISSTDDAAFVASFGLQFDHPAGFAGQPAFPGAAPADATGWTNVPMSYSPAKEMRLRVLDFGTDKYGLNAYIYDATNDGVVNYNRVRLAFGKDGAAAVGDLVRGGWADVKVKIVGGALNGLTAGMLVKVEELKGDLSQVRLFHTSVSSRQRQLGWLVGAWFLRRFRRVRGSEVPHFDGSRLCHPRSRDCSRRDLRRAGTVLGDRPSPGDQVHPQQVSA